MWVAQITEPASREEAEHQYETLTDLFPCYTFSVLEARNNEHVVIARPQPLTVPFPEDVGTEVEMLQFIVTEFLFVLQRDQGS